MHGIKTSGHLGIKKTFEKIRQQYYWPGLRTDVKIYASCCDVCAKRMSPAKRTTVVKMKTSTSTSTSFAVCKKDVPVTVGFRDHIMTCALKRIACTECGVNFKKVVYLKRHYARTGHDKISHDSDNEYCSESASACSSAVNDKEDHGDGDWDSDSEVSVDEKGSSSDEDSDLELGGTGRKRTASTHVQAPVKRA
ncbi:hypothetical protein DPMN_069659 [Dreissena polymorpha]|uniref:C2H2-type domain-containing protein n=1 Tax=Dreissena polymorpha TaxID=45954 RepID=A0A9D3YZI8_DREPO|nr:hypothetical protein DPMN_069659 [Dreissena polymorpha]